MLIPKQAIPGNSAPTAKPTPQSGNPIEKAGSILSDIAKAADKLPPRKTRVETAYGTYEFELKGKVTRKRVDDLRERIEQDGIKNGWARVDGTVADDGAKAVENIKKATPAQYEQAKKAVAKPAPKAKASDPQPRVNSSAQSKVSAFDQSLQDPTADQLYTGGDARLARNGQGKGKTSTELRRMAPSEDGVNVNDKTKQILQGAETVIGTVLDKTGLYRKANDLVSNVAQSNERANTYDPVLGFLAGAANDALHPVSSFASATGNAYDPNATLHERLGAIGNMGLYALGAEGNLAGAMKAAGAVDRVGSGLVKNIANKKIKKFAESIGVTEPYAKFDGFGSSAQPKSGTVTPPEPHFTNGNEPTGMGGAKSVEPPPPSAAVNSRRAEIEKRLSEITGGDPYGFSVDPWFENEAQALHEELFKILTGQSVPASPKSTPFGIPSISNAFDDATRPTWMKKQDQIDSLYKEATDLADSPEFKGYGNDPRMDSIFNEIERIQNEINQEIDANGLFPSPSLTLSVMNDLQPNGAVKTADGAVVTTSAPMAEAKAAKASATESGGDLVGYAKQITGNDPLPGVNRDQLLKAGEDAIATGKVNPDAFVDDVIKKGKGNGDEQATVASIIELRRIRNRQAELEKMGTPEAAQEWTALQERADKYSQAGDIIGNDWHRTGMALQVALKQDMSLGALKSRAKMMNYGADVSAETTKKLEDLAKAHADALKEIERLKTNNAEVMGRIKTAAPGRLSVASREKARSVAADYFAGKKLEPTGGVGKNRQRGAVSYTITPEEARAKSAIRKLAKEIALDGAETLDDVLNGIRKEIGVNVKDEDLLGMIYEPYSKFRIEADVARIKANNALADVQAAAKYRAKSVGGKAWDLFSGALNGVQRSFQMGADFSAPLIQGRKGITTNPSGWLKAYAPMFKATVGRRSNDVALKELARIENHTMYPRAKAAGLDITTPGGKFTAQEETFAGNIGRMLEVLESNKGVKRAVGMPAEAYLNVLQRSEDAFTTYMNALRYDTFVKMAKAAPDDPAYLKDVASLVNVIYGRGTGDLAKTAGKAGNILLAPRYLVSQLQFSGGVPIFTAKTAAGRNLAIKTYAKYVAGVTGLMYSAKLAGWEVGNDPRATDFGRISKDGVAIDLFGKEGQFIKLGMQNFYGKISQKGNYSASTGFGQNSDNTNMQFITAKLAPLPKTVMEWWKGVYDDTTGKARPIQLDDYKLRAAPLWVQETIKEATKWQGKDRERAFATLVGIFGLDVKPRDIANPDIPLEYTKPGIYGKN